MALGTVLLGVTAAAVGAILAAVLGEIGLAGAVGVYMAFGTASMLATLAFAADAEN